MAGEDLLALVLEQVHARRRTLAERCQAPRESRARGAAGRPGPPDAAHARHNHRPHGASEEHQLRHLRCLRNADRLGDGHLRCLRPGGRAGRDPDRPGRADRALPRNLGGNPGGLLRALRRGPETDGRRDLKANRLGPRTVALGLPAGFGRALAGLQGNQPALQKIAKRYKTGLLCQHRRQAASGRPAGISRRTSIWS